MKDESSVISGYHRTCLLVLLLFVLFPLATVQVTHSESYALASSSCQAAQNQYPNTATAGHQIVIITTVSSTCVTYDYNEVIVNILLPNTSRILSTASATNGPATNTVTAPATGGIWNLVVQVLWINYPEAGTLGMYQITITIIVNGPSAISKVTSTTASSTRFISSTKTSSTVLSYSTLSSVQVVSSSPTSTSESTFITSSILLSNSSSNNPFYSWLNSPFTLILAVALGALLVVGVFVLRRRRR